MQVDRAPTRPTGDEDEESLFGSPPPSPVRGRSPQLALPTGPGSAENVGTIALPGSHYCSELAIDPAILLLSSPSSTRDSSTPSTTTSSSPPSTLCSSSHGLAISSESSKAPKKPQNVKEGSATPHPPPTIHFPDPDEPLPSNFLRSQQALLGHAGLIGGLDPSALFTRYHRGTTSQNPIIVEDELDPPLLGKQNTFSLHPSSLPSPSNEEVVSSLVKQRNIFPVLESLLRLLSGAGDTTSSITAVTPDLTGSSEPSQERGSAPKRRRLNSVPAGAADWDVPYPFQRGEGPSQYRLHWEKERLKQLLSQLAVLIKGAKRSAAARTYIQQHATSQQSAIPSFLKPPTRVSCQHQPTPGAEQHDSLPFHADVRDITNTPNIMENIPCQTPETAPRTAPLDDLITSLLYDSISRVSSPSTQTSMSSSSSLEPALHHSPLADVLLVDSHRLLTSVQRTTASSNFPTDHDPPREIPVSAGAIPDTMIDPTLLGKSFSHNSDLVDHSVDSTAAQWPITPTFPQSPIASTSSVFDPLTPREDFCSEPDVYRPEQAEDPICATTALLHMATPASLQATQSKVIQSPPLSQVLSVNLQSPPVFPLPSQPSAIVTATTTPTSSRAPSVALKPPTITQPAQALPLVNQKYLRTQTPLGNNALSKQEMIQRAKERRQQLLAELEKAKVELWEATIEQGVLIHLLKEEQHGRQ